MTHSKKKEEDEYYSWSNIFMKILVEFVATLVFSTIFCLTFYMGVYHIIVTAVLFGGLMYATYPLSGGFIDPMLVVGSFFAGQTHKLGKGWTEKLVTGIGMVLVHFLATGCGTMIVVLLTLSLPIAPTFPSAFFFTGLFAEFLGALVKAFTFFVVTDATFGMTKQVYEKDNLIGEEKQVRNHYGLAMMMILLAVNFGIVQLSGAVLHGSLGFVPNIIFVIWTLDPAQLVFAFGYLGSEFVGTLIAAALYYMFKYIFVQNKLSMRKRKKRKTNKKVKKLVDRFKQRDEKRKR